MEHKRKYMRDTPITWLYYNNVWNLAGNLYSYSPPFAPSKIEWQADFLITPFDGILRTLTKEQSFQFMKEGNFMTLVTPQFLLDNNASTPRLIKPTLTEYLFALKHKKYPINKW